MPDPVDDVPISALDQKIYRALNADPEARAKMLPEVKRLFPTLPLPDYDGKVAAEKLAEEKIKPLLERIDELQAKQKKRDDDEYWEGQRNLLRRDGVPNDEIQKFEEWMTKEWAGGQMDYKDIYRYKQLKELPLVPNANGIGASGLRRSQMEADWRQNLKNDPTKNPSHKLFKGDKKEHFRQRWNELGGLFGNNK